MGVCVNIYLYIYVRVCVDVQCTIVFMHEYIQTRTYTSMHLCVYMHKNYIHLQQNAPFPSPSLAPFPSPS